jgi:hypothetical protein
MGLPRIPLGGGDKNKPMLSIPLVISGKNDKVILLIFKEKHDKV